MNTLQELAEEYHRRTEEYDRTVCTGPIKDGVILPRHPGEYCLIAANARFVLKEIMEKAAVSGHSRPEVFDAIRADRYSRRGPQ